MLPCQHSTRLALPYLHVTLLQDAPQLYPGLHVIRELLSYLLQVTLEDSGTVTQWGEGGEGGGHILAIITR